MTLIRSRRSLPRDTEVRSPTRSRNPIAFASIIAIIAVVFFGLGSYIGARYPESHDQLAGVRSDRALLPLLESEATGTAGPDGVRADRAALVADIKRQLQDEMGLLSIDLLRRRRESFVELYSDDDRGSSSYGTAGYLGNGYFITVKHGVRTLGQDDESSRPRIISVKLAHQRRLVQAKIVDTGDAKNEVDPGDWAILKVSEPIDLPALNVDMAYDFAFASPIFRLGNDYSQGIVVSVGYVGQKTPTKLVTCLTDGHPGVSGGGVLNQHGDLVGIPVGRMQQNYRFSFILPLRREMFRKVAHLSSQVVATADR